MGKKTEKATVAEPLFISQGKLEGWISAGEASFENDILTLTEKGASYAVEPAVQVLGIIDGDDTSDLVGRILSATQIQELGGEHYRDSLIVGDTGYQCEEGFTGVQRDGKPVVAPSSSVEAAVAKAAAVSAGEPEPQEDESDEEMLVDFLLKHL